MFTVAPTLLSIQVFPLFILTPKLLIEVSQDLDCWCMLALLSELEHYHLSPFPFDPLNTLTFTYKLDGYWACLPCNLKVTPSANILGAVVGERFEDFSLGLNDTVY
jgi:hypothetical protein